MGRLLTADGKKNLVGPQLRRLRNERGLSQEALMAQLQLLGMDSERGVIKRIEQGSRMVSDLELKLLCAFFQVSYQVLLGDEKE